MESATFGSRETARERRLLTFNEFTVETGIKTTTGRKMIRQGILPTIRAGRRVYISRETVERFVRGELSTHQNTSAA